MEIALLILIILLAWFWLDSLAKRERAIFLGRELAHRLQLQLLDETVACTRMRVSRNFKGHAQLLRTYAFECSANGAERLTCELTLLGNQLQHWHIPPYVPPQATNEHF